MIESHSYDDVRTAIRQMVAVANEEWNITDKTATRALRVLSVLEAGGMAVPKIFATTNDCLTLVWELEVTRLYINVNAEGQDHVEFVVVTAEYSDRGG